MRVASRARRPRRAPPRPPGSTCVGGRAHSASAARAHRDLAALGGDHDRPLPGAAALDARQALIVPHVPRIDVPPQLARARVPIAHHVQHALELRVGALVPERRHHRGPPPLERSSHASAASLSVRSSPITRCLGRRGHPASLRPLLRLVQRATVSCITRRSLQVGQLVQEQRSVLVAAHVDRVVHERLLEVARGEDRSLASLVRRALDRELERAARPRDRGGREV